MTFAELQAEVFRRLAEDSADPDYWSVADVKDALNEAYEEMADSSEFYERNAVLNLLSGRTYYDLRSVLGTDTILSFLTAYNSTTRRWLEPIDVRELDMHVFQQWENVGGEPENIFLHGLWWLGTYPKAASDSGYLKVYYTVLPPRMVDSDEEPAFPEELQEGLIEYALGDLLSQEAETQKALIHFQQFSVLEEGLVKWVDGRIARDRMRGLRA